MSPHYGNALKSQQGATAKLRDEATFAGGHWSAFTEVHPPGAQVATDGHSCVFAVGCEHFGAGLYGSPSAMRYRWLIEDKANPRTLVNGPLVSLMAPNYVVHPPLNVGGQLAVQAEFEAPEFEQGFEEEKQYPDAVWARITKYELQDGIALEDLMSDNADLCNNPGIVAAEEFEWELIEKGGNPLSKLDKPKDDIKQIVRRIETYRFIGPVTDENEPDCDAIDCDNPVEGVTLGALIGANVVAQNLFAENFNPAPMPVPAAAWLFGSALAALGAMKRRKA